MSARDCLQINNLFFFSNLGQIVLWVGFDHGSQRVFQKLENDKVEMGRNVCKRLWGVFYMREVEQQQQQQEERNGEDLEREENEIVCVCVCVCVWQKEKKKHLRGGGWSVLSWSDFHVGSATIFLQLFINEGKKQKQNKAGYSNS